MKIKLLLVPAVSLCLAGSACQNTVNTIENTDKTMVENVVRDTRFVTDSFLKNRLALQKINTAMVQPSILPLCLMIHY